MIIPEMFLLPAQIVPLDIFGMDQLYIVSELMAGHRTFCVLWPSTSEGVTAEIISSDIEHPDEQDPNMLMFDPMEYTVTYKLKIIGRQRCTLDTDMNSWIEHARTIIEGDTLDSVQTDEEFPTFLPIKYDVTILPHDTSPECPVHYGDISDRQFCGCEYERYKNILLGRDYNIGPYSFCGNCIERKSKLPFYGLSYMKPRNLMSQIILLLEELTRPGENDADIMQFKPLTDVALSDSVYYCPNSSTTEVSSLRSHDLDDIYKLDEFTTMVFANALKNHKVHHCSPIEPRIPPLQSLISRMALEVARTSGKHMFLYWLIRSLPIFTITDMFKIVHTYQGMSEKLLFIYRMLRSHIDNFKKLSAEESTQVSELRCPFERNDKFTKIPRDGPDCLYCASCGMHITNLRFLCNVSTRKRKRIKYKSIMQYNPSCQIWKSLWGDRLNFPDYEEPYIYDPTSAYFEQERDATRDDGEAQGIENSQSNQELHNRVTEQTYEYTTEPDYFKNCPSILVETDKIPGDISHVFSNSYRRMFEIVTFTNASTRQMDFVAEYHFTWFRGYEWLVASCPGCLVHIGWKYRIRIAPNYFEIYTPSWSFPPTREQDDTANTTLSEDDDDDLLSRCPTDDDERGNSDDPPSHASRKRRYEQQSDVSEENEDDETESRSKHFLYNTLHNWNDVITPLQEFYGLNKRALTFKRPSNANQSGGVVTSQSSHSST